MTATTLAVLIIIAAIVVLGFMYLRNNRRYGQDELANTKAEARRWVERLAGQVMNLTGTDTASKQALADAAERYNAAGSQLDQATTPYQARLARQSALEGLYYVKAARTAMGLDPGPELPDLSPGDPKVTEERRVDVHGTEYRASPQPGAATPYFYPGGRINGRPVPQGWYSTPWWKTALTGAAAGFGGFLIADALFGGMGGMGYGGYDAMGGDGGFGDGGFGDGGFGDGGFDDGGGFGDGGFGDFF